MRDITNDLGLSNVNEENEVVWDEALSKIILFRNDDAYSFINLQENTLEEAVNFGKSLLDGNGELL